MRVLQGHVARILTWPVVNIARIRNFSHSSCCLDDRVQDDLSCTPKVTRKRFSDLPKQHLLADGTPAAPMPEWEGGLQNSTTEPGSVTIFANNLLLYTTGSIQKSANIQTGVDINLGVNADARNHRKNVSGSQSSVNVENKDAMSYSEFPMDSGSQVMAPEAEPILPPRKRGKRKKTKSLVVEIESSLDHANTVPRNVLATEILQNLANFPNCILLTRVGQFYESYFDQAPEVASLLNIKLTSRTWDKQRVPMCGFPLPQLDRHLKVLVQQHKRFVAVCEEFPRPPSFSAKDGFDRRVVRVVTPGTLIDESFLNPYENNYLLAICPSDSTVVGGGPVGLAWMDVSTGEFLTKSSSLEGLRDDLARISPREIVLEKDLESNISHPIRQVLLEEGCFVSYATPFQTSVSAYTLPQYDFSDDLVPHLDAYDTGPSLVFDPCETSAIKLLTGSLNSNLLDRMTALSMPSKELIEERMQIDSHTIKALEIRDSIVAGGTKGSLLSVIKRTQTTGGTRLLARWLCSPSTSMKEINARQSLVSFIYARPHLQEDLIAYLSEIEDVTRKVQRFILGHADTSDLVSIHSTISVWNVIRRRLEMEQKIEMAESGKEISDDWTSISALFSRMNDLSELSSKIASALHVGANQAGTTDSEDEESCIGSLDVSRFGIWRYGPNKWAIKPEFSEQLLTLHSNLKILLDRKDELERKLQQTYAAPSLTLRSSPGQGMYVHVQRSKRNQMLVETSHFVKLTESGSTATYFHHAWSVLGNQIIDAASSIYAYEKEAFESFRNEVIANSQQLRRNARIMDELDVTVAFAKLAKEMNWIRPTLVEEPSYDVANGRHPTVELGLLSAGRVFTPNSVSLTPTSRVHILTGPNMAGKSTLLRQTALIAILAQIGSFVPADNAVIGIVDRLFSRVGATDDLFRDRSTFMVEMLETATILRRATKQSLVIMDEVGRGTTVRDGLAIAFATVHHLVKVNGCRSLFATHFHELSDMLGYSADSKGSGAFSDVAFFCTDVDDIDDGRFAYSYRIRPGVNKDSHGLKVAELAQLPSSALLVAKEALLWLKARTEDEVIQGSDLRVLGQSLAKSVEYIDSV